jgi:hypothetical protein
VDPVPRRAFNDRFDDAFYRRQQEMLEAAVGPIPYRLAESPVFIAPSLRDELYGAAEEIIRQLAEPSRLRAMKRAIPSQYDAPRMDDAPTFMTVDMAIVGNGKGGLTGKVVELQAFPSLFLYTMEQARVWSELLQEVPGLDIPWSCFRRGMDRAGALSLLRHAILGGEDPAEVVLLEIDPLNQKTRTDFIATERLLGVDAVCVTDVIREGRRLFRNKDGRLVPIRRLYNRVVYDELEAKRPAMSFSFTDDLDVTFAPHPNWYWVWSKFSLPFLDHPAVPRATFLSDLREPPADLSTYVLKPLFSFAGAGVKVDPTRADLDAVPVDKRPFYILQQKIEYARALVAPEGFGVAGEMRVLCARGPGDALPRPFMNLFRLSRGKMLGIDFNKGLTWVGSSVGISPSS